MSKLMIIISIVSVWLYHDSTHITNITTNDNYETLVGPTMTVCIRVQ